MVLRSKIVPTMRNLYGDNFNQIWFQEDRDPTPFGVNVRHYLDDVFVRRSSRKRGCEYPIFDSDEYWECALRTIMGTYYHVVGACKMGPKNDSEAVVDHNLRVHGIKQLRVVDVSIIPEGTSSHTVAPAYMLGEKASDMIKKTWKI